MSSTRQAFLTRRRVLRGAGGAGLVAATAAAETITGSGTAEAGTDGDHDTGLQAQSNHAVAVVAASGMTGVYAQSGTHDGFAITHDAVRGYTDAAAGAGVRGENFFGGDGVAGFAGSGGSGVAGTTTSGTGGSAGVVGTNKGAGPGVRGIGGTGVLAQASAASSSIALSVEGPARFSLSDRITIARGSAKATATGVRLTRSSMVLATVQEHMPGVFIEAAVPDFDKSSVTVYLSKAAAQNTKVAWFVVN